MTYPPPPRHPTTGDILAAIHRALNVTPDEIMGQSRFPEIVRARAAYSAACRMYTNLTFCEIAHGILRENHSGVVSAAQRVWADDLERVCSELKAAGFRRLRAVKAREVMA